MVRPFCRKPDIQMKTLRALFLISLAAAAMRPVVAADSDAAKKDIAALQGEWVMVSGSADGQAMPEDRRKQMKRICKGDEVTVKMGEETFLKAKFAIDPSSMPKTIDYEMTEGFTKGKKQLGIYELEGDTFKACFAAPGGSRPADFTSKEGEQRTLSVWKRQKEPGAAADQKK
jgi:uncharacterized protein (TIGR03067 family)